MAVEETLSPNRRLDLHRRFLAALAEPRDRRDLTRLAHHAETAADKEAVSATGPRPPKRRCGGRLSGGRCAVRARAAIRSSMTAGERAELFERQSDSYYLADDQVAAIDALRQAIDLHRGAGDTSGEARALAGS